MTAAGQQNLFDTAPQPEWEEDDASEQLVASVIFPTGPDKPFDYLVPDALREAIDPGRRVRAPFGRGDRPVVGYCVRLESRLDPRRRLKSITEVVDSRSLLSPAMLRLTQWMAARYMSNWGQALETVLPAAVRERAGTRSVKMISLSADAATRLANAKLSEKQQAIVQFLSARGGRAATAGELTGALKCTLGPVGSLARKGLVQIETRRVIADLANETVAAPRGEPRVERRPAAGSRRNAGGDSGRPA